jgi:short-subunit dehydrogenase
VPSHLSRIGSLKARERENIVDLQKYGPWALVVGGSEGVGAEFARQLAADGFKLVLTARKIEPLEALAAELRGKGAEVRIKSADLMQADALAQVRSVTDDIDVGLLVYNAGANDTRGNFLDLPSSVPDGVIAINVLGQTAFARHYGVAMKQRGRGGIILTGSLGGYLGSGTLAAYTASKAFSRIFTEALWAECQPMGIDVLHLNIGFTATPAMARLGMPIDLAEPCENVAREGLENIANGPIWIVSTPGNVERARMISVVDDRAAIVRANAIVPRDQTAQSAMEQKALVKSD